MEAIRKIVSRNKAFDERDKIKLLLIHNLKFKRAAEISTTKQLSYLEDLLGEQ